MVSALKLIFLARVRLRQLEILALIAYGKKKHTKATDLKAGRSCFLSLEDLQLHTTTGNVGAQQECRHCSFCSLSNVLSCRGLGTPALTETNKEKNCFEAK